MTGKKCLMSFFVLIFGKGVVQTIKKKHIISSVTTYEAKKKLRTIKNGWMWMDEFRILTTIGKEF